jgi:TonB family protein
MTRPTALLTLTVAIAALGTGCATSDAARGAGGGEGYEDPSAKIAREEQARYAAGRRHEAQRDMKLDSELGVLDTAEVEDTLQSHFDDVRGCYERAGKAQGYAGGRVLMRFHVAGDGHVDDVWVVESSLGNYSVERCLVEVGRRVVFGAPSGHKSTTFDYPVEFRSTNQVAVLDIDGLKIDHDLTVFLPQLGACGPIAKLPATAIMYIEPSGFPGSVGLAVEGALDEGAASCVVQTIQRWKMSAALPGHVLRANFRIPTVIASAEPPPRRAVSSASARKRRR